MDSSTSASVRDQMSEFLFKNSETQSALCLSEKGMDDFKGHKRIPSVKAMIPCKIPRPKFANKIPGPQDSVMHS